MLGFNRPEMILGAMQNLDDTTTDAENRRIVKTVFDCGYPFPDPALNSVELHKMAAQFGWNVIKIPNRGVVENHNVAIHEHHRLQHGDFYVTFDPDVRMQQKGWVTAMVNALRSDDSTVFVCAARPFHDEEWCSTQHGRTIDTLPGSGFRVGRYRRLIAWSMGMYKGEWLACRPRDFCASNPFYGYSEHCELDRMNQAGKTWCQVVDFYDHHLGAEPLYTEWKSLSASHKVRVPFEEWLGDR